MPAKDTRVYTFREQIKGFPWGQIAVVAIIRFAEPIAFTSLFPYIYFMVKSFHPDQPEHIVARYAGYISGTFALCQSFTGIMWGRLSDKYGRKPIIVCGLIFSGFWSLLFGLSKSFKMALLARALGGLFNGNIGVIRTALGEIAVKRHHQPLAFTVMPLLWQVGCVIGPMVGGYTANPIDLHHSWFEEGHFLHRYFGLFTEYPYLLPNLIVSAGLFIGAIFTLFFLEETHMLKRKNKKTSNNKLTKKKLRPVPLYLSPNVPSGRESTPLLVHETDSTASLTSMSGNGGNTPSTSATDYTGLSSASTTTNIESETSTSNRLIHDLIDIENQETEQAAAGQEHNLDNDPELHKWSNILVPRVRRLLLAAGTNSLQAVVYDELLPVYLCASVVWTPGSSLKGGLGLSSENMGTLLSCCGVVGISSMLFIFPWIERNFGCVKPLKIGSKIVPIFSFVCPFYLYAVGYTTNQKLVLFTILAALRTLCQGICYPALLLLFNQSAVHPLHMGTINGCCQMVSALARAIGPIVWGVLMDFGQQKGHVEIPWWSLTLFSLISALQINTIHGEDYNERE